MFACQSTPDFFSSEATMTDYSGHWSYDQSQHSSNHQNFPYVGSTEMVNNRDGHTTWLTPQESTHVEHNIPFEVNNFHCTTMPQHSPIQYTPLTPEPAPYPVFNLPRPTHNNINMAKRHRAMITLVPTKSGNFQAIVKRKRKRTVFTTEQVEALEDIFKRKQYVTREERGVIVNQLQLNDKAVKIWFQNRRLKDKREPEQIEEDQEMINVLSERSSPDAVTLDSVESKIIEKTDEFGYVALDDSLIKDLFNVIDDVLTSKTPDLPVEDVMYNDSSPIYEPISPASVSDSNDEESTSSWQPSEPNESLQRLFDLQSMLSL